MVVRNSRAMVVKNNRDTVVRNNRDTVVAMTMRCLVASLTTTVKNVDTMAVVVRTTMKAVDGRLNQLLHLE
jgi:hypothetical protein